MIIKVRRGLEANRLMCTPQMGEPIFTTDTNKLYIGDGETPGGILVDMQNGVQAIIAGTNISVDNTNPAEPVVSAVLESAVDSVNGQQGVVVLDADDIDDTSTTHKFATAGEKTKIGYITVTQAVDLDTMETNANNVPGIKTKTDHITVTQAVDLDTMESKLAGIENGADVTDTANVTAAGALMDSEVTNLAAVKAFNPTDYATSTQGGKADTAVQPGSLAAVATTGAYADLSGKPTIPTSVDQLNPSQTGNAGKFLKTDGTNATWESIPGGGDMLASTYDPTNKAADAFSMGNMVETSTKKILSDTERTKISHITVTQAVDLDTMESKLAGIEANADVTDAVNIASSIVGVSSKSDPADADTIPLIDSAASNALKELSIADLKIEIGKAMYPVGSIYTSVNSTNPNTSLGFGTWSAFGAGRVPVGYDSGQTEFDTDEETGGVKEVTLTAAQSGLPAHNHGARIGNVSPGDGSGFRYSNNDTGTGTVQIQNNTAANASQAHTNLQPYIVVRMWKRTA